MVKSLELPVRSWRNRLNRALLTRREAFENIIAIEPPGFERLSLEWPEGNESFVCWSEGFVYFSLCDNYDCDVCSVPRNPSKEGFR